MRFRMFAGIAALSSLGGFALGNDYMGHEALLQIDQSIKTNDTAIAEIIENTDKYLSSYPTYLINQYNDRLLRLEKDGNQLNQQREEIKEKTLILKYFLK